MNQLHLPSPLRINRLLQIRKSVCQNNLTNKYRKTFNRERLCHVMKQMLLLFTALVVGNMAGRLLGIQKKLNRLVMFAKDQFDKPSKSQGFKLTSALYCLTPFAAIGACMEGLTGDYRTLLLKAVMDGMAAHSFYRLFGGSVVVSAIPLLAFQGNLTLIVHWILIEIALISD